MKANTEILWLAFSILDKDYEPNITPQKRFYFNKFGKASAHTVDIGNFRFP